MTVLFLALLALRGSLCVSFALGSRGARRSARAALRLSDEPCIDIRKAPGDPSLILTTNVKLDDKAGFVAAASAAVAQALSKPEAYVAICVTDNCDGMSFGGTMDPCAVGCVYSIGQINQENNAALTAAVSVLLEKHGGVANNRIYINFFDVPRANCGWSGRTFAG